MGGSGAPGSTVPLLLSLFLKWGSLEADGQLIVPSESVSWLVREAVWVISLHLLRRYRVWWSSVDLWDVYWWERKGLDEVFAVRATDYSQSNNVLYRPGESDYFSEFIN